MPHIAIIGAGITGVTTAYELAQLGYQVTVFDRHLYPAMETSFANGGQLSACNAEVWNQKSTIIKGLKWINKKDAPLLLNPSFNLHKYKWLIEFLTQIKHYESNTIETVKLALQARQRIFELTEFEQLDFDLEKRGILHIYHNEHDFNVARQVNTLLCKGGLKRHEVNFQEIMAIEPTLTEPLYAGFYTPDDATGDIHKFTTHLAGASEKYGVRYLLGSEVINIKCHTQHVDVQYHASAENLHTSSATVDELHADAVVICGGVMSYALAQQLGDPINIYPVKGYSITIDLNDETSRKNAPWVSLLDESAKIVSSRLGQNRFRVAGTAEFNGYNRDIRADRIQPLIDWVNRYFDISTEHVTPWSGLRPMTPNMMPRMQRGKHARVFYNTGHGHLGFTLSTATAMIISQLIAQSLSS